MDGSLSGVGRGRIIVAGISGIWPATETAHVVSPSSSADAMGVAIAWEYGPIFAGAQYDRD